MKNKIQQEILLVITTSFSQRQLCEKYPSGSNQHLSLWEQLEEACWNGLLDELLPEIMERQTLGKKLYLWHIWHGEVFLQIALSEFPQLLEKQSSINSRLFLETIFYN